jgi:3-hydroxyisobutyrate dehydrogenase
MIGFLGLGNMGEPMALNLIRAGTPVLAWSRSDSKYPLITAAGGRVASTVDEVFDECGTVLLMLANGNVIDEVLGRQTDLFAPRVKDRIIVHMGTTPASYSEELGRAVTRAGGQYVEAPVSGSRTPAEAGQLVGMVAGDPQLTEQVRTVLTPMLLKSIDCGTVPNALRMKLAVNLFLITQVVGLAESFQFAARHQLDLGAFRDVLDSGPMASAVSKIKLEKLVSNDYSVQAAVRDVHYNSRLISGAVREMGFSSPLIDVSTALFERAEQLGYGAEDMAAVVKALFDPEAREVDLAARG